METGHPAAELFGSEVSSLCSHCGVMAPYVARLKKRCRPLFAFFGKTTPYGEIFRNSVPQGFTASPIDVLCGNLVKFGGREIGTVVRYIPDI